ncbi:MULTISPECIES: hypothetical protein [unclassified Streptomyces]|uniref:hypothetical protein n=1 Tax=unclassified Streptomyces TaxID=2593676 RepID=UPI001904CAB8|nr:hypothetical protein [Streptomyces sp. HSG2]
MDFTDIDLSDPRFTQLREDDKGEVGAEQFAIAATPASIAWTIIAVTWSGAIAYYAACT